MKSVGKIIKQGNSIVLIINSAYKKAKELEVNDLVEYEINKVNTKSSTPPLGGGYDHNPGEDNKVSNHWERHNWGKNIDNEYPESEEEE